MPPTAVTTFPGQVTKGKGKTRKGKGEEKREERERKRLRKKEGKEERKRNADGLRKSYYYYFALRVRRKTGYNCLTVFPKKEKKGKKEWKRKNKKEREEGGSKEEVLKHVLKERNKSCQIELATAKLFV